MGHGNTYFEVVGGKIMGNLPGILPVTLFRGMIVSVHGYEELFEVVTWSYRLGHEGDPEHRYPGLTIILRPAESRGSQNTPSGG